MAVITGAHGVRGVVKVKAFTEDPAGFAGLGAITDAAGARVFRCTVLTPAKGVVLTRIDGVDTRDAAEALRGTELYVLKDRLPPPGADEFFYSDLIGLDAVQEDGARLGRVKAMAEYGAGDVVEITLDADARARLGTKQTSVMIPFTKRAVPAVELAAGRLVVCLPAGLFDMPEPEPTGQDGPDPEAT